MATVHVGRLLGTAGFARTVAVKRPLPALTRRADFRRLAWNEARLGSRVCHPNVVATLDVIEHGSELLVVMDYVHGESLAKLMASSQERQERIPLGIVRSILAGTLRGLEAVHRARDEKGQPLGLIHRDVSPQNILCGVDGSVRLSDFGLAKAARETGSTRPGEFKGKLTYAAPEQLGFKTVTAAIDIYSAGLILWELLTGRRVHAGLSPNEIAARLLRGTVPPPSAFAPAVPPALESIVMRAIERDPARRFESALAMAMAIEASGPSASSDEVGTWVQGLAAPSLAQREQLVLLAEEQTSPSQRGATLLQGASSPSAAERRRTFRERASGLTLRVLGVGVGIGIAYGGFHLLAPARVQRAVQASKAPTEQPAPRAPRADLRRSARPDRLAAIAEPDCSPPFSLDADGVRRMKPGCE